MQRVLLIYNPEAGDGEHTVEELCRAIASTGRNPCHQSARLDDFACALDESFDLIVVAGGDGAVTKALRACSGLSTPVAIVPLGTANNVATGLGHLGTIPDLVKRWEPDSVADFYLGEARGAWGVSRFVESFGIGLLAQTIVGGEPEAHEQFRDRDEKLNTLSDRLRAIAERLAPERLEIKVDGRDYTDDYLWLEAGRVGFVGPKLPIADEPDPWGRHLQIGLLPAQRRERFLEALARQARGDNSVSLGIRKLRGERVTVSWASFRAHIDGVVLPRPDKSEESQVCLALYAAPVKVLSLR